MAPIADATTALIVVHLQHDIVSPGTAFGGLFNDEVVKKNIVANCNEAARKVRAAGGQVFALRIAFQDDHSDLNPSLPLLQLVEQTGCLKVSDRGSAIVDGFEHDLSEEFIHLRPGPFTDSDLEERLRAAGIKKVVVCGVATNASVEGSVRQAADLGFDTYVLTDASSAADDATHDASVASMTALFASAATVAEL